VLSNEKRKQKILICEVHATGLILAINPDFCPFNNYGPERHINFSHWIKLNGSDALCFV
jgi:hypothetical protein